MNLSPGDEFINYVKSQGSETEQLPLKATSADVNIAGVIVDVSVKQVYEQNGKDITTKITLPIHFQLK